MDADPPKNEAQSLSMQTKQNLLKMSEISLWLDDYSDLFSDFDPRLYAERSLSQDFLAEIQRASRDKATGQIELKFLIPSAKRNHNDEAMIKRRLKEHFKKHFDNIKKDKDKMVNLGSMLTIIGILLMFAATFVLFKYQNTGLMTSFMVVFLEPGGWFFFWEGMYLIVFESKKLKPNMEFYSKMHRADIEFLSY